MEYTETVLEKFLIDLHSNILPGLDDGAKTGEISRRMLAMAAAEGTDLIYATPHLVSGVWEPRWEEIAAVPGIGPKTALAVKAALDASGPAEALNTATGELEQG